MIQSPASTSILPPQNTRSRLNARQSTPLSNFSIFCSKTNSTDRIRSQLDQLHIEADQTWAKANNARLRLLRLTEAAENLRRQAAVEVRVGKEDEARVLLIQKLWRNQRAELSCSMSLRQSLMRRGALVGKEGKTRSQSPSQSLASSYI